MLWEHENRREILDGPINGNPRERRVDALLASLPVTANPPGGQCEPALTADRATTVVTDRFEIVRLAGERLGVAV